MPEKRAYLEFIQLFYHINNKNAIPFFIFLKIFLLLGDSQIKSRSNANESLYCCFVGLSKYYCATCYYRAQVIDFLRFDD